MKRLALLALVSILAVAAADRSAAVSPDARNDVELLLTELERIHPNPHHAVSRAEMRAAADELNARLTGLDDNQMLVELMRLVARLGERDGHAGVALFSKAHFHPVYVYNFSDGIFVVAAINRPSLVGARLVAIGGRPVEEVLRLVEPLMTRDNAMTIAANAQYLLAAAEVLHGLGVTPTADSATFTFDLPSGSRTNLQLRPLPFPAWSRGLRSAFPTFAYALPRRAKPLFEPARQRSVAHNAASGARGLPRLQLVTARHVRHVRALVAARTKTTGHSRDRRPPKQRRR